jgi:hypothetical protein
MALDVYSTPPMHDEPKGGYKMADDLLMLGRRTLIGEGVEKLWCLRSWQKYGTISLDQTAMQQATEMSHSCTICQDGVSERHVTVSKAS